MDLSALLEHLNMLPSSGSRTIDRLVARGLVDRQLNPVSCGEVVIGLTLDGAPVVGKTTPWRRREIAKIAARMPESTVRVCSPSWHTSTKLAASHPPMPMCSAAWIGSDNRQIYFRRDGHFGEESSGPHARYGDARTLNPLRVTLGGSAWTERRVVDGVSAVAVPCERRS